jgi:hypothetical protein
MLTDFGFDKSALTAIENYNSRNGFSLIDNDEYKSITGYFAQYPMYKDIIPIMTDNQSNYICVYKSGALFGKVCHVSHEEVSMEPKFRSIENLIATINQNPDSWEWLDLPESTFDYPQKAYVPDTEDDKKIIPLLRDSLNKETDDEIKVQTAFCIMALTPPENLEDIYPFLDDDDMYIQERAIRIFGFHKYKPAVPKLRELETTAKHNGQFAAKLALKKIQSEQ